MTAPKNRVVTRSRRFHFLSPEGFFDDAGRLKIGIFIGNLGSCVLDVHLGVYPASWIGWKECWGILVRVFVD